MFALAIQFWARMQVLSSSLSLDLSTCLALASCFSGYAWRAKEVTENKNNHSGNIPKISEIA